MYKCTYMYHARGSSICTVATVHKHEHDTQYTHKSLSIFKSEQWDVSENEQ